MCFTVELSRRNNNLLVPMRLGDTPVPIPNTTVKTQSADGTALETVWESRWAPDQRGELSWESLLKQGVESESFIAMKSKISSGLIAQLVRGAVKREVVVRVIKPIGL